MKIEHVGNAPSQDVGQFAGHGIFRDIRNPLVETLASLRNDPFAHFLRKFDEAFRLLEFPGKLGKRNSQRRQVVFFTRHGVADDDGSAVMINFAVRVAIVLEYSPSHIDAPTLSFVHGGRHLGWNGQSPVEWLPFPVADPAADPGIGFVRCLWIDVEVQVRIPSLGIDVIDAVAA